MNKTVLPEEDSLTGQHIVQTNILLVLDIYVGFNLKVMMILNCITSTHGNPLFKLVLLVLGKIEYVKIYECIFLLFKGHMNAQAQSVFQLRTLQAPTSAVRNVSA